MQNTALLVMDMQANVLAGLNDPQPLISRIKNTVNHARQTGIPVLFIVVGFRSGGPEISSNNMIFAASKARLAGVDTSAMTSVHPDLTPLEDELVIVKRRVSAFAGSDLEIILRAQNIQHIILTGVATSGVVLSTLREAADKDFRITVLSDCCGDSDDEVQRVLTEKVFPKQATVLLCGQWLQHYVD